MSAQDLIFACIEHGSFNCFDGPEVVAVLKAHAGLWEAVTFGDEYGGAMTLRDLPRHLHLSALYIRSSGKDDRELERLLKRELGADEVDWVTDGEMARHIPDRRVLRAWWD